ncbi:FIG00732228: membrane protein [hydrothermal vent metagenome]|uniref:FIG00732228: membrane protein n=1 Tax=hydrothermal vent metagenome TaxID=652676 RepID=A0A1W1EBE9_9ZZZZ
MAKQRFRDVKQGNSKNVEPKKDKKKTIEPSYYATTAMRFKAFGTDLFMLVMPIMYIVFYLILDGREDFAAHKIAGWLYILIPLIVVQTIFMFKTGQTPGFRAYDITLIDETTKKKPSLFIILFRNVTSILSLATFFGWIMMFFRKDSKTLHDLLSNTAIVIKYDKK